MKINYKLLYNLIIYFSLFKEENKLMENQICKMIMMTENICFSLEAQK